MPLWGGGNEKTPGDGPSPSSRYHLTERGLSPGTPLQKSAIITRQSPIHPLRPQSVSGCLKVVKKAGTVPVFSSVLGFLSAPRQPRFCDRIRYRRREQCKHSATPLRGVFPRFLVSTWQVDMIPSAHGRQLQSKLAKNECSLDKKSSCHFSKPLIGQ